MQKYSDRFTCLEYKCSKRFLKMGTWQLDRLIQCRKCPWRVSTDPFSIPNGYSIENHENLSKTIAGNLDNPIDQLRSEESLKIMACHENHQAHCIGWINNQMNQGNNIKLRILMMKCDNIHQIKVFGDQHANFTDTFPKEKQFP